MADRYADEHDLMEELLAEDLLDVHAGGRAAFVEPDDEEYDWSCNA